MTASGTAHDVSDRRSGPGARNRCSRMPRRRDARGGSRPRFWAAKRTTSPMMADLLRTTGSASDRSACSKSSASQCLQPSRFSLNGFGHDSALRSSDREHTRRERSSCFVTPAPTASSPHSVRHESGLDALHRVDVLDRYTIAPTRRREMRPGAAASRVRTRPFSNSQQDGPISIGFGTTDRKILQTAQSSFSAAALARTRQKSSSHVSAMAWTSWSRHCHHTATRTIWAGQYPA